MNMSMRRPSQRIIPCFRGWIVQDTAPGQPMGGLARRFSPPFGNYWLGGAYDEMFATEGTPRPAYRELYHRLLEMETDDLRRRQDAADLAFLNQGITFTVYGAQEGIERIWPYDLLPRIITGDEWRTIERGLAQRITALNHFLGDIY